ncbi:MAG: ABC transporter ATP-binding protein [Acidobacteriota bacterium]|nr:ABC transporter ATP-binding protein [Acidobacteriota bacterium]
MSALLRVEGLRLSRTGRAVLDGISFRVAPREICALMGLSGSGKTTVLRAAVALEGFQAGRIEVGGFSLGPGPMPPESRLRELRRRVGMVFQSHALFEHLTALENTALAPVYAHGRTAAEARARGLALLDSLGIGARASAYPRELSGGEAQRVAIAVAMANEPALLLADEVVGQLDGQTAGRVVDEVMAADFAVIFVTHDMSLVSHFSDRLVVMYAAKAVEIGPTRNVFAEPGHPYTQGLLDAFPSIRGPRVPLTGIPGSPPNLLHPPTGCRFAARCPHRFEACVISPGLYDTGNTLAACHLHAPSRAEALR